MENDLDKNSTDTGAAKQTESKPNERASFYVSGHVKIFDPETKEVILETRA